MRLSSWTLRRWALTTHGSLVQKVDAWPLSLSENLSFSFPAELGGQNHYRWHGGDCLGLTTWVKGLLTWRAWDYLSHPACALVRVRRVNRLCTCLVSALGLWRSWKQTLYAQSALLPQHRCSPCPACQLFFSGTTVISEPASLRLHSLLNGHPYLSFWSTDLLALSLVPSSLWRVSVGTSLTTPVSQPFLAPCPQFSVISNRTPLLDSHICILVPSSQTITQQTCASFCLLCL